MIILKEKMLCLSQDSNHRSPVFHTGGLPIRPPRNKLLSHSSFQFKTHECNMLQFA